ncbi:phospholipase-like protein [Tanacetum coccineum]
MGITSSGVSIVDDEDIREGDIPSEFLPCQLPLKELNPWSFTLPYTIGSLNLYVMSDLGASINVMPESIFKHLKIANLKKTNMVVEMNDMTRKAPEPDVEHANVMQIPNLEKITSRWHVCKPIRVFYDDGCGKDCGMWPTCNLDLSFCNGYDDGYGKGEHGMLKQWLCFRDHERQSVKGNRMIFVDFLKVRYENKNTDDTNHERQYYEWVVQNSEFNDDEISHKATMYDNPCKYHHEYPRSYFPRKDKGMPKPWEPSGYTNNKTPMDYEKCENIHGDTLYQWHDDGFEEEEQWESGIEKTDYEPPFVDIETFEIKRFIGMIRKEMDEEEGSDSKEMEFKVTSTRNYVVRSLETITRLHSSTWATKWFKRLVAYAKCNRDSYKRDYEFAQDTLVKS